MYWAKKYSTALLLLFFIAFNCSAQNNSAVSFLALGDSYTIGESVPENQRWPVLLADSLESKGIQIGKPKIIAKTGWTTDELITAIKEANPATNYDLVSLLIGVNNQYRGYDIATFKTEFEQLLKQAITFADGKQNRVFVVSIPDYGVTPFGQKKNPKIITKELIRYNKIAHEISQEYNVSFINITPISKRAAQDSSLVAGDGLHPSGKMYQQWVSKIVPVILPKLQ